MLFQETALAARERLRKDTATGSYFLLEFASFAARKISNPAVSFRGGDEYFTVAAITDRLGAYFGKKKDEDGNLIQGKIVPVCTRDNQTGADRSVFL